LRGREERGENREISNNLCCLKDISLNSVLGWWKATYIASLPNAKFKYIKDG
jgi:hypothetical protein